MNPWLTITATIIAYVLGTISTLVTQRVNYQLQREKESKNLRLQKLEELYEVLTQIRQHYKEKHIKQSRLITPKETWESINKYQSIATTPLPFNRMEMLVKIYALSLQDQINDILKIKNELGDIYSKSIMIEKISNERRKDLWNQSCQGMKRMEYAIDKAQDELTKLAANLLS